MSDGKRSLVFGDVDGLPLALDDAITDLRGRFALVGLLVGVEVSRTKSGSRPVFAGEAIEQTGVTLAASQRQ